MDLFHAAEMEGELMLIGIIAIVACFVYHKLDKMMEVQLKTNELLEKLVSQNKNENKKED